jgi:radical SAM superfamily enzyme
MLLRQEISMMTSHSEEVLSIEEVVGSFSEDLPDWQKATNLKWLTGLHSMMAEGAVWISPGLGTIYHKRGEGFVKALEMENEIG